LIINNNQVLFLKMAVADCGGKRKVDLKCSVL
jgi:hypothetical protein